MSLAEPPAVTVPAASKAAVETPFRRFAADFLESRIATLALLVLLLIVVLAILAPWIAPQNPYDLAQVDVLDSRLPPGTKSSSRRLYSLARYRRRRP